MSGWSESQESGYTVKANVGCTAVSVGVSKTYTCRKSPSSQLTNVWPLLRFTLGGEIGKHLQRDPEMMRRGLFHTLHLTKRKTVTENGASTNEEHLLSSESNLAVLQTEEGIDHCLNMKCMTWQCTLLGA
eukprot:1545427-Amphidinium_carterae.1